MASYIQHLDDLKDKYQNGIVSLLIGTGFSQNAYHDMPLWDGLLLDMAKEQYDDNLSESELKTIIKKNPTTIVETYLKSHNRSQLDSYIEDIMFSETRQFLRLNINQVQKLSTLYILLVETVGVEPTSQ